jgi:hypothetical protein
MQEQRRKSDVQAEESIGMAMTFTIASAAREILGTVITERARREKEEEDRKAAEYEEVRSSSMNPFHPEPPVSLR